MGLTPRANPRMPIATTCPACRHAYRLKDELAGKRVKCKNPACQETFTVPRPAAAQPATVPAAVDADTLAAQALADEPEAQLPAESRTIAMTCVACEHQWSESWDKQGKNVLCPECRQRQKVPVPQAAKPADWRTGRGGPSLARQPELEGVNASGNAGYVSGEALRSVGWGSPNWSRARSGKKSPSSPGRSRLILFTVLGVRFYLASRSGASEAALMATPRSRRCRRPGDTSMPKSEVPPARAALLIAGGEYNARRAAGGEIPATEAVKLLARARQELADAAGLAGARLPLGRTGRGRTWRWAATPRPSTPSATALDAATRRGGAGAGQREGLQRPGRVAPDVRGDEVRRPPRAVGSAAGGVPRGGAGVPRRRAAGRGGQLIPTLFTDDGATEALAGERGRALPRRRRHPRR